MKPLSQMTREELCALTKSELIDLAFSDSKVMSKALVVAVASGLEEFLSDLDDYRLELQQSAAEAEVESHREYWRGEGRIDGLTER